jgi:hypothetical protein
VAESEIDPQAVFVSEAGEIAVCPQYAGSVIIHRLKTPMSAQPWPPLLDERIETVLYDTIRSLPERAQKAIMQLLRERQERDALLDRCYDLLYHLKTQPLRPWDPAEMDLEQALRVRHWRNKERQP